MTIYNELITHKWVFDTHDNSKGYDFDSIFERFKNESELPKLFDALIETLEKIIASGEIDSIKLTNSLNNLISTLKKNKSGSYFSIRSTWDFVVSLLKNYIIEELSQLPALGSMIKALAKTMNELEGEMELVHHNMAAELKSQYKADFNFLSYTKKGDLIE